MLGLIATAVVGAFAFKVGMDTQRDIASGKNAFTGFLDRVKYAVNYDNCRYKGALIDKEPVTTEN